MEDIVRYYACAAGRVQGVGFRMFVRQQALAHEIAGWVRNMPDGTVTMELQGAQRSIDAAFAAIRAGNMFVHVERLDVEPRETIAGDRDFSIRY
jgi:acylphosphatase